MLNCALFFLARSLYDHSTCDKNLFVVAIKQMQSIRSRRTIGNPAIIWINAVSLAIGFYGFYYNIWVAELPAPLKKAGSWQFLTNLSLVYSLVVFAFGFAAHVLKSKQLYAIKNLLHPIGLALESIVACVYWPLRIFFIHLLTAEKKIRIGITVDLAIHLMPVVSLMVDYLVFMPKWTISIPTALALITFLTSCYWVLLKRLIDVESGAIYPYAFMNVKSEKERVLVFVVVGIVSFVQFLLLRRLYDLVVDLKEEIDEKKEE